MKITYLGTGSSTPTPQKLHTPFRSFASLAIEIESDYLLFDIGPGTVIKMLQGGIDILKKPTHLFIGHYHLDHCLDFIPLMKARALHALHTGEKNSLEVFGPQNLQSFCEDLFTNVKMWRYMTEELRVFDLLNLHEVRNGKVTNQNNWSVTSSEIQHYNGVCYKIEANNKSIVYSSDMGYDERICELGKNTDIAILECSYPTKAENKGLHLYSEAIGKLAKKGKFKHVFLTHLYPTCEGREEEIIKNIKEVAHCEVSIACDLLEIQI